MIDFALHCANTLWKEKISIPEKNMLNKLDDDID
jgi:hypothetical protein